MSTKLFLNQLTVMQEFGGNYLKLGDTFYTDTYNSLKLIEYCRINNMIILGIETFKVTFVKKIMVQPNMKDDIYYNEGYEKLPDGNYQWDTAARFIKDSEDKNLIFEVDFKCN